MRGRHRDGREGRRTGVRERRTDRTVKREREDRNRLREERERTKRTSERRERERKLSKYSCAIAYSTEILSIMECPYLKPPFSSAILPFSSAHLVSLKFRIFPSILFTVLISDNPL